LGNPDDRAKHSRRRKNKAKDFKKKTEKRGTVYEKQKFPPLKTYNVKEYYDE
jgi:hypothetical protein